MEKDTSPLGVSRDEFLKVAARILACVDGAKGLHEVKARKHYRAMSNSNSRFWDFESELPKGRKGGGVSYL